MYSPSSSTIVTVQPSLTFIVNYNKLLQDYYTGVFNRPIPFHVKLLSNIRSFSIKSSYPTNVNHGKFNLPYSTRFLIVSSNQTDYTIAQQNVKDHVNNCTYRCLYCTRDIKENKVGIPFIYKLRTKHKSGIIYTYQVFYCNGNFDNYNCAWTYLIKHNNCNPEYFTAMSNMLHLLKLIHPNKNLRVLPDPSFLVSNGGTLTDEEFDDDQLVHIPHPLVVLAPFKSSTLLLK